jgi:hypothetical protein
MELNIYTARRACKGVNEFEFEQVGGDIPIIVNVVGPDDLKEIIWRWE